MSMQRQSAKWNNHVLKGTAAGMTVTLELLTEYGVSFYYSLTLGTTALSGAEITILAGKSETEIVGAQLLRCIGGDIKMNSSATGLDAASGDDPTDESFTIPAGDYRTAPYSIGWVN